MEKITYREKDGTTKEVVKEGFGNLKQLVKEGISYTSIDEITTVIHRRNKEGNILAYKILDKNNNALFNDFHYEIGQTYELSANESIEVGSCGFHFYEDLQQCFVFLEAADLNKICLDNYKIVEVEVLGDFDYNVNSFNSYSTRACTNKIKILRELDKNEYPESWKNYKPASQEVQPVKKTKWSKPKKGILIGGIIMTVLAIWGLIDMFLVDIPSLEVAKQFRYDARFGWPFLASGIFLLMFGVGFIAYSFTDGIDSLECIAKVVLIPAMLGFIVITLLQFRQNAATVYGCEYRSVKEYNVEVKDDKFYYINNNKSYKPNENALISFENINEPVYYKTEYICYTDWISSVVEKDVLVLPNEYKDTYYGINQDGTYFDLTAVNDFVINQ